MRATEARRIPASAERELRTPGQPLDTAAAGTMRSALGVAVNDVRVHVGPGAAASTAAVGARAYTVGHHIVFGAGSFAPTTLSGRGLLAHELTHVVQQRGGRHALAGDGIDPDGSAERQAQQVGDAVEAGTGATAPGSTGTQLAGAGVAGEGSTSASSTPTGALQRSACEDAGRLRAERAGVTTPPVPAPAPQDAAAAAATDAAWASAANSIDFALSILEHPVARTALGLLPIPVTLPPHTRDLVREALPHLRGIWELISDPVRLMTEVQTFVDGHLAGVPEAAREWLGNEAFGSLRETRHLVGITLGLGDAVAELLGNWTAPFVTAWQEFAHPLDVEAEMADLACIQERYARGDLNAFEAYTAIYGWLVGWVNRYAVYVGIALVVGGAVVGALGGGGVGGAGGAAAGGVGAAPGGVVGGGGGAAAGAGAGWAISEEIGIGILAANALHMLLQVIGAGERLLGNDAAAAGDARAGRTPSDAVLAERSRRDEESYATIAQVLLGLGIMGALVLLAAFGSQFARVAVAGLSRRYPTLGRWLAETAERLRTSDLGGAAQDFEAGRKAMRQRLDGEVAPAPRVAAAEGTAVEIRIGGEAHHVSLRNGRIWLCSDNCGALIEKLEAMLDDIPGGHPDRASFEDFLADLRDLETRRDEFTPDEFDVEVRVRGRRLEALVAVADDAELGARLVEEHLPEGMQFDEDLDPLAEEFELDPRNEQSRFTRISDAAKAELEDSDWLKRRLSRESEPRRRFMKWLEANHNAGEEHRHLSPGSPYAEEMLARFREEEGV